MSINHFNALLNKKDVDTLEGIFSLFWEQGFHYATNTGVNEGNYCFALSNINNDLNNEILIEKYPNYQFPMKELSNNIGLFCEINYHACGSQLFYSKNDYMLLVVAVIDDEQRWPDQIYPSDFQCFIVQPNLGIHINSYVWHAPPINLIGNNNQSNICENIITKQSKWGFYE